MAPSWSQAPDLCLLAVFKHIPLSDLIRNSGLVCTNWLRLQRDEFKRRRSQTKELALIQNYPRHLKLLQQRDNSFGSELIENVRRENGSSWELIKSIEQIRFDALLVPGDGVLREAFVLPLMKILMDSNITQLTLVQRDLTRHYATLAVEQMTRLINHFSASLVTLKLDVFFLNNDTRNKFCVSLIALFNSINQLDSLQHLTLNGNFPDLRRLPLSILSRLATFTTNRFEPAYLLTALFRQIDNDVRINCDIQVHLYDAFWMTGFNADLPTKFTRIRVKEPLTLHLIRGIRQLGARFVMLTSLELTIDSMSMTMIAECLVQQTELIHLKLNFDLKVPEPDGRKLQPQISQIPSVRLLTLSFNTRSHRNTKRLYVPEIFPNLQVLHLSLYTQKCTECGYEIANANQLMDDPELCPRIEHCLRLTRQPFRRCTILNTIKFDVFGPLQSIRPQGLITLDQL